jgi:acetyl esterase/lipase
MNIEREVIREKGLEIPCVMVKPPASRGAALIVHGYGGSKEEQLGLAWRVAECGVTACAIDHRGHGEHRLPLDEGVVRDVEGAIAFCRAFGKVAAIGHSSGGRLCLASSADFVIALSPAIATEFSPETETLVKGMRGYRAREAFPGANFEIVKKLPVPQSIDRSRTLILFGSRDVPEIVSACRELEKQGLASEIDQGLHTDIFLLEETFRQVTQRLGVWF